MSPNKVHSLTVDNVTGRVCCFSVTFGLSVSTRLPAFPELMNKIALLLTDTNFKGYNTWGWAT